MTFNSVEFALLLLGVLTLHWTVGVRWRNHVVLLASYAFYGWWDWRFLGLLIGSTLLDHTVARLIHASDDPRRRRRLLLLSVSANLGVLGLFKYYGFFVDSMTGVLGSLGLSANPALLEVVLPVGISFYTFQTIAYTVDVYRGEVLPARNLVTFATFVAYFPQLVAGPIERARRLLPQIAQVDRPFPDADARREALSLILLGLVRKVVIADGVAPLVNDVYADIGGASAGAIALAAIAFSLQVYGDFGGYAAIARGVSLLLGVRLMVNFREPYLSRSMTEFWQRWHISLSTWLRDYLFIPLGGSRGSTLRTLRNLFLTMLLGGLWHGAANTFVVWGGLNGLYLVVHRLIGPANTSDRLRAADAPRILGTFLLHSATLIMFRATSLTDFGTAITRMATLSPATPGGPTVALADLLLVAVMTAITLAIDLAQRREARSPLDARGAPIRPAVRRPVTSGAVAGVGVLLLVIFSGGIVEQFIYFAF